MRGHHAEGRHWLARVLALPAPPSKARLRALHGAGMLQNYAGNRAEAHACLDEALAVSRALGDPVEEARCFRFAGLLAQEAGDFAAARRHYQAGLDLARGRDAPRDEARLLRSLGALAHDEGDFDGSRPPLEESLALWRQIGSPLGAVSALMILGQTALAQADYATARACHEECLSLTEAFGSAPTVAWCWGNLADVALADGRIAEAESLYARSLERHAALESWLGAAESFRGLGAAAATWLGRPPAEWPAGANAASLGERTARLFGVHDALRERLRIPLTAFWRAHYEGCAAAARQALGDAAYRAAWEAGRALPLDQAVRAAVAAPLAPGS
jgi:tetratricopeptide (TPR) repeat protein